MNISNELQTLDYAGLKDGKLSKKSIIMKPLVFLFAIILLHSCGNNKKEAEGNIYNCKNVEDCLSKFEFEGARYYSSSLHEWDQDKAELKIVRAESSAHASNNDFLKAMQIVDESNTAHFYSESDKFSIRFNVIDKAVDYFLENSNFIEAKKWALKASDDRGIDGKDRELIPGKNPGYTTSYRPVSKVNTQKYKLNKKIEEYQSIIK